MKDANEKNFKDYFDIKKKKPELEWWLSKDKGNCHRPLKNSLMNGILKINLGAWECSSVVEHLASVHKALDSKRHTTGVGDLVRW